MSGVCVFTLQKPWYCIPSCLCTMRLCLRWPEEPELFHPSWNDHCCHFHLHHLQPAQLTGGLHLWQVCTRTHMHVTFFYLFICFPRTRNFVYRFEDFYWKWKCVHIKALCPSNAFICSGGVYFLQRSYSAFSLLLFRVLSVENSSTFRTLPSSSMSLLSHRTNQNQEIVGLVIGTLSTMQRRNWSWPVTDNPVTYNLTLKGYHDIISIIYIYIIDNQHDFFPLF